MAEVELVPALLQRLEAGGVPPDEGARELSQRPRPVALQRAQDREREALGDDRGGGGDQQHQDDQRGLRDPREALERVHETARRVSVGPSQEPRAHAERPEREGRGKQRGRPALREVAAQPAPEARDHGAATGSGTTRTP